LLLTFQPDSTISQAGGANCPKLPKNISRGLLRGTTTGRTTSTATHFCLQLLIFQPQLTIFSLNHDKLLVRDPRHAGHHVHVPVVHPGPLPPPEGAAAELHLGPHLLPVEPPQADVLGRAVLHADGAVLLLLMSSLQKFFADARLLKYEVVGEE